MKRIATYVITALALGGMTLAPAVASGHRHGRSHGRHGHHGGRQETAGTIASFTNGVLTVTPSGGGAPISGQVNSSTEIECEPAESNGSARSSQPTAVKADHGSRGGSSDENDDARADDQANENEPAENEVNQNEANENEPAENEANENDAGQPGSQVPATGTSPGTVENGGSQSACDSTALRPGTVVRRARLRQTDQGPAFRQVKLVL